MGKDSLALIEDRLHDLMRSRVRELFGALLVPLPRLHCEELADGQPRWLPVDGMYGGFKYWLEGTGEVPHLHVESWSRIIGYSGMAHVVTPTTTTLIRSGFG